MSINFVRHVYSRVCNRLLQKVGVGNVMEISIIILLVSGLSTSVLSRNMIIGYSILRWVVMGSQYKLCQACLEGRVKGCSNSSGEM